MKPAQPQSSDLSTSILDMAVDDSDIEPNHTFDEPNPVFIPHSFISTITNNGRPRRSHRLPKRYLDLYPEGPAAVPVLAPAPAPGLAQTLPHVILHVKDTICTTFNSFRLMRKYPY